MKGIRCVLDCEVAGDELAKNRRYMDFRRRKAHAIMDSRGMLLRK